MTMFARHAIFGFCLLWLALLAAPPSALGAEGDKQSFVVGEWAFKRLSKAHELIGKGKLREALDTMQSMSLRKKLNDHERALMWQTMGYIYSAQERYGEAIGAFEKSLALGAMPPGALLDTQFNLGQIYLAAKRYDKAVATLRDWIGKVDRPTPETKHLLATAYMQAKDYRGALPWIQQAIADSKEKKEPWLQLQLAIHFELKQTAEVARMLERLVVAFPKKTYWMQLSAGYLELKRGREAAAVMELIYLQGLLTTAPELNNLASLLLQYGVPYKAAGVIERGMRDGVLKRDSRTLTTLADAWLRARELDRAVLPLGQAAEMADKGDLFVRLAQVYLEQEKWPKAADALQSALKKGKLTDPGNAHLLLGISLLRAERLPAAARAFEKALEFENTRRSAEQWLKALRTRTAAPAS